MSRRTTNNITPALAASVLLHGGAVVLVLIAGIYFKKPPQPPGGVPITIVTEGPPQARQAEQGDVEEVSAGEEVLPEPLPEPVPVAPPLPDPTPKPAVKPPAKAPTPAPKRKADLDFDRLLADVQGARPPSRKPPGGGGGTGKKDRTLAVGTSREPSAGAKGYLLTVGQELGRRWNPNCNVEGGDQVDITLQIILNSDGRLLGEPKVIKGMRDDPITKAAILRAITAVHQSEPFRGFPAELAGENLNIPFKASEACKR